MERVAVAPMREPARNTVCTSTIRPNAAMDRPVSQMEIWAAPCAAPSFSRPVARSSISRTKPMTNQGTGMREPLDVVRKSIVPAVAALG